MNKTKKKEKTNQEELLRHYYQRIRPVVGDTLKEKKIAFLGARNTIIAIDAFARCGTTKMLIYDSSRVEREDLFSCFLGNEFLGMESSKAAVKAITRHNTLEDSWELETRPGLSKENLPEVAKELKEKEVDIIFGGGSLEECLLLDELSRSSGIPAVIFCLFSGCEVNSAVFLGSFGEFLKSVPEERMKEGIITKDLSRIPLKRRFDFLECNDLAMMLAYQALSKGSRYERKDLNRLVLDEKKDIILIGSRDWPWQVDYLNTRDEKDAGLISSLFSRKAARYYLPLELLKSMRVMVLGCGTGSLCIGELANIFGSLLLVDCKKFSSFNPVRQLAGTRFIGREKAFALQKILKRRILPSRRKRWDYQKHERCNSCAKLTTRYYSIKGNNGSISGEKRELWAAHLALKEYDHKSVSKFEILLDDFKPDLVIVAMGQALDDNFVATRILRKRGIRHIIPSAFPSATHYEDIFVDGKKGPCYSCLQSTITPDLSPGPELTDEQREMFYGGSQPATVLETLPSAHSITRIASELALDDEFRSSWFLELISCEENCLVGGNKVEMQDGSWLYGVGFPGQVVSYGTKDIFGARKEGETCECGRINIPSRLIKSGDEKKGGD